MMQTPVEPGYNELQLQEQLATNIPQKVVLIPNAFATNINILSEAQFIKFTYESNNESGCCCTFRFWSLFGWILSLVLIIIGCIAAAICVYLGYVFLVVCNGVTDDDTDTVETDTLCSFFLVVSSICLVVCIIELIAVSFIIHGIRKYNYCICIFATVLAGLNAFASFGPIAKGYTKSSIAGFIFFTTWFIINGFHTYNVKKARDAWLKRVNPLNQKEMIINN
eukprot:324847_1